jgi:signal transduction histidine kinase
MKPMKRRPPLMLVLVIALLALLPLLAVLQYRWLGQVSEGERERMKNNLNASARRFCQDFDDEITAVFLLFQPFVSPLGSPLGAHFGNRTQDNFAERYRHWRATAAHPRLVKEVYQTQMDEGRSNALARFNPASNAFEAVEWPESLSALRKTLESQRAKRERVQLMLRDVFKRQGDLRVESGGSAMVVHLSIGPVDEDLPGLIIPINDFNQEERAPLPAPRSYRIIAFDDDYIRRELIPELAGRHFAGNGASEYNLAVTRRRRAGQPIYRSDDKLPASAFAGGDAAESFFRIRLNNADRLFFARWPHADEKASSGSVIETHQRQVAIRVAGEFKAGRDEQLPGAEDAVRSFFDRKADDGPWQLVVKHREGSLDAAVGKIRRRNLTISFGVLLLLGVSVGLIVLSSRRAQRLATQQMEFVAGVSHELRTPLAVICSAAENLADGVIDNDEQIKRYGGLIRDEGRRLTGMVEQVLEFAGAQSGRKTFELRPTELEQVVEDAMAACHLQLVEGGFEIEKSVAADLPLVKADAAALSRALQNLLSNAMKYSGDSRWIGLSVRSGKGANGEEVRIEVSDRGLGIEPTELAYIFEPFYRVKEAAATQIRGNGLGLSLVKHIVTAHGGRVSVKSRPRQMTTFTLHLPVDLSLEKSEDGVQRTAFRRKGLA